jgi:hypothetical protein
MTEFIAWCGFVGAWLLVFGPLNQAIREVQEEEFERDSLERAEHEIAVPPPVSIWWLLVPPVYLVQRRRRDQVYKARIRDAMSSEDLRALAHLRDVATAWFLVAAGAALLAVKETWDLVETYDWSRWAFWVLVGGMFVLAALATGVRIARPNRF